MKALSDVRARIQSVRTTIVELWVNKMIGKMDSCRLSLLSFLNQLKFEIFVKFGTRDKK